MLHDIDKKSLAVDGWVGGWSKLDHKATLRSILQAETCQILSLAVIQDEADCGKRLILTIDLRSLSPMPIVSVPYYTCHNNIIITELV